MTDFDNMHGSPSEERLQPTQRPDLTVEDIASRTRGNCLLSFGFPGSGKTTFQSFLLSYLKDAGPFQHVVQVPQRENGSDWKGREIVHGWLDRWDEGRFPEPTPAMEDDIQEIHLEASTTGGKRLSCELSFLEVSGELLQRVLPEGGQSPEIARILQAYLENERLKFVVMLMINPDVPRNDRLFSGLMAYLDHNFPGFRDRMSLGIILSKPEACLEELRKFHSADNRQDFRRLDGDAQAAYLNRFCGETYQIWRNWPEPKRTLLSPLHLGEITTIQGEQRLKDPNYHHVEQIFFWIVEQFTGQRPGPTWWQRFLGQMDWQ